MSTGLDDLTVIVPTRNAAPLLPACLDSVRRSGVAELIVVDGLSSDGSREIAGAYGATVLSDDGRGLPHARSYGVRAAHTTWVALVDADVVLPDGSLQRLLEEFREGQYAGLQAGLASVGGPGYWGRALAHHHRTGRSRWWFGVVATIFRRDEVLAFGFDDRFRSGEDIELRWRLDHAGLRTGVSHSVLVEHRFADDRFDFARDQFLMDGVGLGLMVRKHGLRGAPLALLPLAAAVRGAALALARAEPQWVPYYLAFGWFNYRGFTRGLVQ
jgi:glycosyltransferase involved in cell wall biosynthesis